jgi:hypothetical protein
VATFQGLNVTPQLVPTEIVAPLPGNLTEQAFDLRLQSGGTMELVDSHWVIGDANFTNHSVVFAALDKLNLKGKSGIITNGNTLVLFVNEIDSEDAEIISFSDTKKAADGGNAVGPGNGGAPGQPGMSGGIVSIHVVQKLNGILHFNLPGQDGGAGGNGAPGTNGPPGSAGSPCQAGVTGWPFPHPGCLHDGGQGSKGGSGSPGGHGGDGAAAGQGGNVFLFNVGNAPLSSASYSFAAAPGTPGKGGAGGAGGPGGDGGTGGDGNVFCHSGPPGPPGDQGRTGDNGNSGAANAFGRILSQNLDLAAVVTKANSAKP